jgi:hypothetical protein
MLDKILTTNDTKINPEFKKRRRNFSAGNTKTRESNLDLLAKSSIFYSWYREKSDLLIMLTPPMGDRTWTLLAKCTHMLRRGE